MKYIKNFNESKNEYEVVQVVQDLLIELEDMNIDIDVRPYSDDSDYGKNIINIYISMISISNINGKNNKSFDEIIMLLSTVDKYLESIKYEIETIETSSDLDIGENLYSSFKSLIYDIKKHPQLDDMMLKYIKKNRL